MTPLMRVRCKASETREARQPPALFWVFFDSMRLLWRSINSAPQFVVTKIIRNITASFYALQINHLRGDYRFGRRMRLEPAGNPASVAEHAGRGDARAAVQPAREALTDPGGKQPSLQRRESLDPRLRSGRFGRLVGRPRRSRVLREAEGQLRHRPRRSE